MYFANPNIYVGTSGFWIRWTLVAFIFIIVILLVYLIKGLHEKSIILILDRSLLLPTLLYLSIIPIYFFGDIIGNGNTSAIYKIAGYLNSIESLVVFVLIAVLIYGLTYKNSHTFINIYLRALAVLEITYIFSFYITNQVKLNQWFNWGGAFLLGAIFVVLSEINISSVKAHALTTNIHDAVGSYDLLFPARKFQANEIIDIITSNISESGYSICITGEWGTGKTSFINGVCDKIKQIDDISLYEIRINALELDDSVSLINYFFMRIETILKVNGIYTGIASEYKELLASISGSMISKGANDFLLKKLNKGNSDYRENIKELSNLISQNLKNFRILIVIDDIERCSPEKAKSYLFLMKELATMNCCVAVFLANIDEMKKACDLDVSFFEKFFNCVKRLIIVDYEDITLSLKDISAEASDLSQEIQKMLMQFDNEIEKTVKEPFLYMQNAQERSEYKEKCVALINKTKEQFSLALSNPRRVKKAAEYYGWLIEGIKKLESNCLSAKAEEIRLFLNKVKYKKQLALLSIIYGLYSEEFVWMQQNGIYNYIGSFSERHKPADEQILPVETLIENEWCKLRQRSSDFKIEERLRFVNCILTDINELSNISNGFNSLEEKYISFINNEQLPKDISFPDLMETIYNATYNNVSLREELIKKVFKLFIIEIESNLVDSTFELFSSNSIRNHFSSETPVLQLFFETFCRETFCLENPLKIRSSFSSFSQVYLWRNLNSCSRYLLPVASIENASHESWENACEVVLLNDDCNDMLNAYCDKCESYLGFSSEHPYIGAIARLEGIINQANKQYSNLNMTGCIDVLRVHDDVEKLVAEITFLFKIEKFIIGGALAAKQDVFNIRELSTDALSYFIDSLLSELGDEIDCSRNKDIEELLQFICGNECSITFDEYEKLNSIVERYCTEHNPVASWRQMLIFINRNKIKDLGNHSV